MPVKSSFRFLGLMLVLSTACSLGLLAAAWSAAGKPRNLLLLPRWAEAWESRELFHRIRGTPDFSNRAFVAIGVDKGWTLEQAHVHLVSLGFVPVLAPSANPDIAEYLRCYYGKESRGGGKCEESSDAECGIEIRERLTIHTSRGLPVVLAYVYQDPWKGTVIYRWVNLISDEIGHSHHDLVRFLLDSGAIRPAAPSLDAPRDLIFR